MAVQFQTSVIYLHRPLCDVTYGVEMDQWHGLAHRTLTIDQVKRPNFPTDAYLVLRLSGRGLIHAWLNQNDYRFGTLRFAANNKPGWASGDNESTIVVPATSRFVITVGAYTLRTQADLVPSIFDPFVSGRGMLAPFSSRGPVMALPPFDQKPDLCAPGNAIVSARAASVADGPLALDANRLVMQGTSMAAPQVAGAIALMLEADPTLNPERALAILKNTAKHDALTDNDGGFGFGKLNAHQAVKSSEAQAPQGGCTESPPAPWLLVFLVFLLRRPSISVS